MAGLSQLELDNLGLAAEEQADADETDSLLFGRKRGRSFSTTELQMNFASSGLVQSKLDALACDAKPGLPVDTRPLRDSSPVCSGLLRRKRSRLIEACSTTAGYRA
mmetsp:Transcript_80908/g.142729  ORF Transcript_80908/g.142729 Transcript_80908/m.142729 type:complete len:106 (-) Transcript_80908:192-509(-)|eukprot:CAMPEP_0197663514 /NCGR_PEP_ID=MMETSP1338-20131121/57698_1 /TAXON_ID=43686 ORGANISM="Pelagodinium beii, Strain RCC1491" /NCGR_SAMPLE_ID=MMETSP1338 /ASSEMBLY_ACC=CAM_ASM_000754 /LENGTH=105 /DNA_ID=CAMNT_0043241923 /DNA_START=17 /DNA_END=334 /DNA_ORIENTATION=+